MQIAGLHTPGQRFRLDNKLNAPAAFWITPRQARTDHFPARIPFAGRPGGTAGGLKFAAGGGTAISESGEEL